MDKFDPQEYLIGLLQKAIAKKKDVVVKHDNFGEVILMTERGEYHSNVNDMSGFCKSPSSEFKVNEMTENESVDCSLGNGNCSDKGIGRNIDELMWMAGYYASQGRLMDGLNLDDVVTLKHWPNLTRLPNNYNSFQMTAMLTRHPTTIVFARRVLKIPQEEINEFYTAAHCAGLSQTLNTPPEALPVLNEPSEGTLLSRIIGRIASL